MSCRLTKEVKEVDVCQRADWDGFVQGRLERGRCVEGTGLTRT